MGNGDKKDLKTLKVYEKDKEAMKKLSCAESINCAKPL